MDGEKDLVKLSVKVPQWMANWIRKKAEEEGESASVIVRRLLRKAIQEENKSA